MAEDVSEVVVGASLPIVPENEAEQQAKQEASLSEEELAKLAADQKALLELQAEAEAKRQELSLEALALRHDELAARVKALEDAAVSLPAPSKSAAERKSDAVKAASESE